MTSTEERKRSANYSNTEKTVLLNVIHNFKNIIECKKTNMVTTKQKLDTWKKITIQFNSVCPNNIPRTAESLRKFYENLKKKARKDCAELRAQTIATGAGKNESQPNPTIELLLPIINTKSFVGLENRFDSDFGLGDNDTTEIPIVETANEIDWGDYTANHLQQPLSSSLENIKTPSGITQTNNGTTKRNNQSDNDNTEWIKRRRPNMTTLTSSNLTKQYSELAAVKLEVANMQKELLKTEIDWKKEEIVLKKQTMLLDIKIKEAALRAMD